MEQPKPTKGQAIVFPRARETLYRLLAERANKGIETYGRSLETFNGRDALQDAIEEQVDGLQYLVQAQMEREETEELLEEINIYLKSIALSIVGLPFDQNKRLRERIAANLAHTAG